MSTTKRSRKRRKRSYSKRKNNTDSDYTENIGNVEPPTKKTKYGDYRRRSQRITNRPNYNDDQYDDDDDDDDIINNESASYSNSIDDDDDEEEEEEDDDGDDIEIQSDDDYDENNENEELEIDGTNNNKPIFTAHSIRNHRSIRTIVDNQELNETEIEFKNKAYQYVNNYFQTNFKNSNQIWNQQKNKYQTEKQQLIQQKKNIKVLPFARQPVITHDSFLNEVAQNVAKTSKYLHITGNVNKNCKWNEYDEEKEEIMESSNTITPGADVSDNNDDRIDEMVEPINIPLNIETCPIPHCTPYVTVNRNHYVKDDKKLRYIPQINDYDNLNMALYDDANDSGTEFEEQEDILLDYIYENLELDDEDTIDNLQKLFYLSFERIQHRIMSLSHHKQKLLKQQKKKLFVNGYDTKNKDIPIDSFSLLFCPRCMTYDCSLHGLDNPRRRNRALPSDVQLRENLDYFRIINENINDPNALAHIDGNLSSCNDMIQYLLPKQYKPSIIYPHDLTQCNPCNDKECYIVYLENNENNENEDKMEWNYMDLANLRRLLNICKKNFCQIASIMGHHISCKNVYIKSKELIPNLEIYINQKTDINTKKMRKTAPREMNREPVELNAENIPHQFFGCNHDGMCSIENNCSCIINKTYCEKFCNCFIECNQRFPGCQCEHGRCKIDQCVCFKSHRECDPDKCKKCQSYLPPNIFNKAIKWLKENEPKFYERHYQFIGNKASASSSSLLSINSNEENKNNKNNIDTDENNNKYSNIRIEIDGFPDIDPFNLCGNLGCSQQRRKKLWIGRSDVHGFGCFAGENILKNEYITEYLGEMISQNEADRRGRVYDEQNISYLFNLNEEYCIDATRKGCKMKFANHSITPNCRAKIITVNGDHRICIYAKKDLQIGHELLFDYRHDNIDNTQQPQWFHYNQK